MKKIHFISFFLIKSLAVICQTNYPVIEKMTKIERVISNIEFDNLETYSPSTLSESRQIFFSIKKQFEQGISISIETLTVFEKHLTANIENAKRTKRLLEKIEKKRDFALKSNTVRGTNPKLFYEAENAFNKTILLGEIGNRSEQLLEAKIAVEKFKSLFEIQKQSERKLTNNLRDIRKNIDNDISALNSGENGNPDLYNSIELRMSQQRLGSLDLPSYNPPPSIPPGPLPAYNLNILKFENKSKISPFKEEIKLKFRDNSHNEKGNIIWRSSDLVNWIPIATLPYISPKIDTFFVDADIKPNTKYCYNIETFNDEGARKSPIICTFSKNNVSLPIWRAYIMIKIADKKDAGSDHPLQIVYGRVERGKKFGISTYLDSSEDDFERNTIDTLDLKLNESLNLERLSDLSEIGDIDIYGTPDDAVLIKSISIYINNRSRIFHRDFGSNPLKIQNYGYKIKYEELLNNTEFLDYMSDPPEYILPLVESYAQIDSTILVSIIESIVGDKAAFTKYETFAWREDGKGVKLRYISPTKLGVSLKLRGKKFIDNNVDLHFEINISKSCTSPGQIEVAISSYNFTSNVNYEWWKDILSLGITAIIDDKLITWIIENCIEKPNVSSTISLPIPEGINCDNIKIEFQQNCHLDIKY